jgi:hypothetical protein
MTASRLEILRLLVEDRHVSLYTLNAPQEAMNGVTPLGFAAWMNSPKAVKTLLEAGGVTVSVDGEDAYGVTPLMCKWVLWRHLSSGLTIPCRRSARRQLGGSQMSGEHGVFGLLAHSQF